MIIDNKTFDLHKKIIWHTCKIEKRNKIIAPVFFRFKGSTLPLGIESFNKLCVFGDFVKQADLFCVNLALYIT